MKKLLRIVKENYLTVLFCYFFGLSFTIGNALTLNKSVTANQLVTLLIKSLVPTAVVICVYYVLRWLLHNRKIRLTTEANDCTDHKKEWLYWLGCMGIQLALWFPILLAYFPGLVNYDADVQIVQHMGTYSNHHPLLHTFYLKFFYNVLGERVFHNVSIGVLFGTCTQMVIFSGMLAYMHLFFRRVGLKKWLRIALLIGVSVLPCVSVFAVSLAKDTLFSGMLVVLFTCLCYWELDPFSYSKRLGKNILYVLSITGMCLMRNNGIYIVVILLVFGTYTACKRKMYRFLICTAAGIVFYLGCNAVLIGVTHAGHATINEALSIPYQQIAYVNNVMANELTEEEKNSIIDFIPDIHLSELRSADKIKHRGRAPEDLEGFLKVYFHLFKRFPVQYVEAFLHNTIGYWYVLDCSHAEYYGVSTRIGYLPTLNCNLGISEKHLLSKLYLLYDWLFSENKYQSCLVMRFICSPASYFWAIGYCLVKNLKERKHRILPFVFIYAFIVTLLMGPMVLIRYALPYILCTPILAVTTIQETKSEGDENEK